MLTKFGQYIRMIRNQHGLKLGAMAIDVGVEPSYLSSVETGKRSINDELLRKIVKFLDENGYAYDLDQLQRAAELSKESHKINLKPDAVESTREAVMMFARRVDTGQLDEDKSRRILEILSE